MANSKRNNNYAHLIEEEKQTADITQKMDICQTAIEIKPADKTAYLELILAMKSDSEYSVDEEQLLVNIINKNEEELKKPQPHMARYALRRASFIGIIIPTAKTVPATRTRTR